MRGKVRCTITRDFDSRITPAYAGKSALGLNVDKVSGDHPRVCGEKDSAPLDIDFIWGSPPRMRGKAELGPAQLPFPGITPAYAGKSSLRSSSPLQSGDHPRVCGEKYTSSCSQAPAVGSPPRMRGKVSAGATLPRLGGITPAYAGKRDPQTGSHAHAQDHPRVCGEKSSCIKIVLPWIGSPPRMRGKGCKKLTGIV